MNHMEDIQAWMKMQNQKVRSNLTVVDNTEGKGPSLYHITYDRDPGRFTPVIGWRQGDAEDRSVPRVCVSTTILGTILGHSEFEGRSLQLQVKKKDENGVLYRGGFYLFEFDYSVAVRPNKNLVYDQDSTDEHWLVTYNKDTVYYKPRPVGLVIPVEVVTRFTAKEKPRTSIEYFVQADRPIPFSDRKVLSPGFYRVKSPASYQIEAWDKSEEIKVTKVTEGEFKEKKKEVTVMETASVEIKNAPMFFKW